ncbi:hypothetical protein [Variovorax sp. E3]|uniref:hypothetical protein n=1 Tax=Variovorax sp. E3 TaxID=1914993 RepID=UPI0018DEA27B|nr:hypothetical protein [Variovorax sp. E3]
MIVAIKLRDGRIQNCHRLNLESHLPFGKYCCEFELRASRLLTTHSHALQCIFRSSQGKQKQPTVGEQIDAGQGLVHSDRGIDFRKEAFACNLVRIGQRMKGWPQKLLKGNREEILPVGWGCIRTRSETLQYGLSTSQIAVRA